MSKEDLESLQQTFTIMDFSPYGQKKVVNLKNLSNSQGKSHEVVVNRYLCAYVVKTRWSL